MIKVSRMLNKEIPSYSGIIILLIASLLIAWITISAGEKVITNVPQSKIFNSQKEAQREVDGNLK